MAALAEEDSGFGSIWGAILGLAIRLLLIQG
jgi:hypothetical protein